VSAVATAHTLTAAGQFADARDVLLDHVRQQPDDADGFAMLGRTLLRLNDAEGAVSALMRAISLEPDRATHRANLASALRRLGRGDAALEAIDKAIALDPARAEFRFNRANLLGSRSEGAVAGFLEARVLNPGLGEAASNLGAALRDRGRLDHALTHLRAAATLRPDLVQAWINLTTVMLDLGGPGEALALIDQALRRFPRDGRLLLNKGIALIGLERAAEACQALADGMSAAPDVPDIPFHLAVAERRFGVPQRSLDWLARGLALDPMDGRAHELRAGILADFGDAAAENHARHAVALGPGQASAWATLAAILQGAGHEREALAAFGHARRLDPAGVAGLGNQALLCEMRGDRRRGIELTRRAIALQPASPDAYHRLGGLLRNAGKSDEACVAYDLAVQLAPANATFRLARAVMLLARGESRRGFVEYQSRWRVRGRSDLGGHEPRDVFGQPEWNGQVLDGRQLTVWGEQGLGDELWFSGYVGLLAGAGQEILIESDPRLVPALRRSFPRFGIYARQASPEPALLNASVQVAMGDLPLKLRRTERSAPTGYLLADPARVAALRSRYGAGRGEALVGISWRSIKPKRERSFEAPLPAWRAVFALSGVKFVNLQYGDVRAELAAVAADSGVTAIVDETIDALRDVDGFLAQVSAMDAVVSIANSTVAAAHAVGRPCHAALRAGQDDWRYREAAPATPWLPLTRQYWPRADGAGTDSDWHEVFARIAGELACWRAAWTVRPQQ
jgi:tetratricopeptide (TPR) repeat protein